MALFGFTEPSVIVGTEHFDVSAASKRTNLLVQLIEYVIFGKRAKNWYQLFHSCILHLNRKKDPKLDNKRKAKTRQNLTLFTSWNSSEFSIATIVSTTDSCGSFYSETLGTCHSETLSFGNGVVGVYCASSYGWNRTF